MKRVMLAIGMMAMAGVFSGCVGGGKGRGVVDEPMRLAQESGENGLRVGDFELAAERFEEALKRASLLDHGTAVARYRYQLAVCRLGQGRTAEAESLLKQARQEALVAGDVALAARADTAAARLVLEQDKLAESEGMARVALERLGDETPIRLLADIRLLLAEIALRRNDAELARKELAAAVKAWGGSDKTPIFNALVEGIQGRLLRLDGDWAGAARTFDRESGRWQAANRFTEHAFSLERAGQAWFKSGDMAGAAHRLYRAARIRTALGQGETARVLAGQAEKWANDAGMPELSELCHDLASPSDPAAVKPEAVK
ncbi:MAG: tetratricopeptide repeat protein [Kiritimatiellia bacterium]